MKYLLSVLSMMLLTVSLTTAAPHQHHPNPNQSGSGNHHIHTSNPHFAKQGVVKHNWGYSYKGKNWSHWKYNHRWSSKYGCYCNYCPYTYCWYYYCAPDTCWYPTSYCPYNVYTWEGDDAPPQD